MYLKQIKYLEFPALTNGNNIHSIWRFPGSFHAPICDWIIQKFTKKSDIILDPMCGSGVLPIQSFINGRLCYGLDIDPFSILMCRAKANPYDLNVLQKEVRFFKDGLLNIRRAEKELIKLANDDEKTVHEKLPKIYNQNHWFRNYVLNDIGRILKIIETIDNYDFFFKACLGTIIRYVSNADPIPISGLEVTTHIKKRNNGRKIDVIGKLITKLEMTYNIIDEFNNRYSNSNRPIFEILDVNYIDAVEINPDVIIFSPPYCNAIEYYRRHRLEYMILNQWKRKKILEESRKFIGSTTVLISEMQDVSLHLKKIPEVENILEKINDKKKRFVLGKYFLDTYNYLQKFTSVINKGGNIIIVIGDSMSKGIRIPTSDLIKYIARKIGYQIKEIYTYPIKNKRMNYTRRNDANIKTEKVLVLSWIGGN